MTKITRPTKLQELSAETATSILEFVMNNHPVPSEVAPETLALIDELRAAIKSAYQMGIEDGAQK